MVSVMKLQIKKLDENAVLPKRGSERSAGLDLTSISEDTEIKAGETAFLHTGISVALSDIPEGKAYGMFIYARSGLACKNGLAPANKVGVVDEDYRGEIMVALHNHSSETRVVKKGERVAQLVIEEVALPEVVEIDELDETDRGAGGFGSTGK